MYAGRPAVFCPDAASAATFCGATRSPGTKARPVASSRPWCAASASHGRGGSPTAGRRDSGQGLKAGGAPDGEPAAEVALDRQVGADRGADLEFERVVPLFA